MSASDSDRNSNPDQSGSNSRDVGRDNNALPALDQAATTPELTERTLSPEEMSGEVLTVAPTASQQLVGTIFDGKYEILSLLGQGGMSAVFKAKNLVLNRTVAIKILLGNRNLNQQALMRFQQEARAASQLDHQNIVKVHDFSVSADHAPYMVMDHLEGQTIAELIAKEGQMDLYRAIDLILQACDALQHAHNQGVVHRDLKPSNIMVIQHRGGREQIKIVDFGVAKLVEEDQAGSSQLTRTGEVFGSPLYMSPEQCLGKKVDSRSDIYSLGCVLFEELAGEPPFRADNVLATMHLHISDAPPEITKVRANLQNGAKLSSILLTALSKNPEQRYQSMDDFAKALQEAALKPNSGLLGNFKTQLKIFRSIQSSNQRLPFLLIATGSTLLIAASITWGWFSHKALEEIKTSNETETDKSMAVVLKEYKPRAIDIEDASQITDASVPLLSKQPELRILFLRKSKISGAGFDQLTRALGPQLQKFSCSRTRSLRPQDLKKIVENLDSEKLTHISMQGVKTTDEVVEGFAKFKNLAALEVSSSGITSRVFKNLPVMKMVNVIMINHTNTNDDTLRDIAEKFPNLEDLHVKETSITDKGLEHLTKLPLKRIWIYNTAVTRQGGEKLAKAIGPSLQIRRTMR